MANPRRRLNTKTMTREQEEQAARLFGKHVPKRKALVLFAVTSIACALPMILGVRFWSDIPAIVETGLIGVNGEDDSMPRAVLCFGIPGLMCLLNLICHAQLYINQGRMTLPKAPVRMIGRWGFPVLSVIFSGGVTLEASGRVVDAPFLIPCVMGLALLLLGSHVLGCGRDTAIALHFAFVERDEATWNAVHRIAGYLWMAAGLALLTSAMFTLGYSVYTATLVLLVLLAPVVYAYITSGK